MTEKQLVLNTIGDLVSKLLYYDRKEDEDLPVGAIEKFIKDGVMTQEYILDAFALFLTRGLRND